MAKFKCVFPSGYSFNDILQYFHTHLTKNHGECTGSSDYSSERARVAVRAVGGHVPLRQQPAEVPGKQQAARQVAYYDKQYSPIHFAAILSCVSIDVSTLYQQMYSPSLDKISPCYTFPRRTATVTFADIERKLSNVPQLQFTENSLNVVVLCAILLKNMCYLEGIVSFG